MMAQSEYDNLRKALDAYIARHMTFQDLILVLGQFNAKRDQPSEETKA